MTELESELLKRALALLKNVADHQGGAYYIHPYDQRLLEYRKLYYEYLKQQQKHEPI